MSFSPRPGSTRAELRKPLGFAMVGGLILSQILTLYTAPVIYLDLDKLGHWLSPAAEGRTSGPG